MRLFREIHRASIVTLLVLSTLVSACASHTERPEFPFSETSNARPIEQGVRPESFQSDRALAEDALTSSDPLMQPGFMLEISNIEDRKLNGKFRVEFDGRLHLPYNVVIGTEGLRLSQLKKKLEESYRRFFQSTSNFTVQLAKRSFLIEVRGLVDKPGRISIDPHASVESVISSAGGLSKELPPKYLRVLHKDQTQWAVPLSDYFKAGSQFAGLEIRAGDTLFFQVDTPSGANADVVNLPTVQIYGEVQKPGPLTYQPGQDIYDYILQAGGPAGMADLSNIRIVRGKPQDRKIADMDLLDEEKRPVIQPGDMILVPFDKPTPTEKKVSQAASIAAIISAIALVVLIAK